VSVFILLPLFLISRRFEKAKELSNNNQTKANKKSPAFRLLLHPYPILTSLPKRQLISFLPFHGRVGFIGKISLVKNYGVILSEGQVLSI